MAVKIDAGTDSITHYKVNLLDSKKNIVASVDVPKAVRQTEIKIPIMHLISGNYTCFVYKGKDQVHKKEFFKDDIYVEPAGPINPKRQ